MEFADGCKASLAANAIAENLFSQVDDEGNCFVMLDSIVDHRVNGEELQKDHAFIISSNGDKRRKKTTKRWESLLQWKET